MSRTVKEGSSFEPSAPNNRQIYWLAETIADSWEDVDNSLTVSLPEAAGAVGWRSAHNLFTKAKDEWDGTPSPPPQANAHRTEVSTSIASRDDKPLLLVDFTVLTSGALHNKFDKAGCNDPDLKRYLAAEAKPPLPIYTPVYSY